MFSKNFKLNELMNYETQHWVWSLRPEQTTLGASIISLKRNCNMLKKVTKDEFSDYQQIVKVVEGSLKLAFEYNKINHLMLMMVDNQVHYHVIPRYNEDKIFNNKLFVDFTWPKTSDLTKFNDYEGSLDEIKEKLLKSTKTYLNDNFKVGYTTEVFDLFHVGHLNILKKAVISLEDRMEIVKGIRYVDKVVVQENMNKMEAWEKYKFDLMFVGSDWQGTDKWNEFERDFLKVGVEIKYIPYTQRVSSTMLREEINHE